MTINCIIVDDEPIAQDIIEEYINEVDSLRLLAKCPNALAAAELCRSNKVDLMFLDIEMPQLDGLSFLRTLQKKPLVVLTSAYRKYALDGFEMDVTDYLLKPVSQERFLKCINKVFTRFTPGSSEIDYIFLKVDGKMVKVVIQDIRYIEGLNNYVKIFTNKGVLVSYQKLSYLEEILPQEAFRRAHRSYIINLHQITAYTSQEVELEDVSLPIGAKHRESLLDALKGKQR